MGILEEKLKLLPTNPGVYVMLDKNSQIIYVGKAKNLKNRVRQYFFNNVKTNKVMAMVSNIADFYYIITPTEIDALSLENNLIKKHKPHYNILLKDDKTYPYLKINLKEEFPVFQVTRRIKKDSSKYFGPFMGGVSVKSVLQILNLAFSLRDCDKKLNTLKPIKPCLNYHIKRCLAPCAGYVNSQEYKENVQKAIDFLNGDTQYAEEILRKKMLLASEREEFESALKYKEQLEGLAKIKIRRLTSLNKLVNADVISYKTNGLYSVVSMLFVRKGSMLGAKNFSFDTSSLSDSEALREFVSRYYQNGIEIPDEIITETEVADFKLLTEYIYKNFEKKPLFFTAETGYRKQLVDMANVNASEHLETVVDRIKHKEDMTISACSKLQRVLGLTNYPKRIECYDISNISGVDKVGSMVVFDNGEPDRASYRRFKIKTFEGADDFRSLKEVLSRRFERLATDEEKFPKPDLIVIDGGKGQLSSVKEVFDEKDIRGIDLISLAEKNEEIFTLDSNWPIVLDKREYCLKMLQRLRDEAHRFAITYHRSLRGKRALTSILDNVKGLGKVKIKLLLEKFKDVSGIALASKEELCQVKGIGEKQAKLIIDVLTEGGMK